MSSLTERFSANATRRNGQFLVFSKATSTGDIALLRANQRAPNVAIGGDHRIRNHSRQSDMTPQWETAFSEEPRCLDCSRGIAPWSTYGHPRGYIVVHKRTGADPRSRSNPYAARNHSAGIELHIGFNYRILAPRVRTKRYTLIDVRPSLDHNAHTNDDTVGMGQEDAWSDLSARTDIAPVGTEKVKLGDSPNNPRPACYSHPCCAPNPGRSKPVAKDGTCRAAHFVRVGNIRAKIIYDHAIILSARQGRSDANAPLRVR